MHVLQSECSFEFMISVSAHLLYTVIFNSYSALLHSYIIGGDFNVCLNPNKDKQGGLTTTQSACSKLIQATSESKDLIDIWRVFNEDTKRFTWRSLTRKGRVSSRLDYWLISSCLLFDVEHTHIDPSIKQTIALLL